MSAPKDRLTDEEMAALEAKHAPARIPDRLTDEEMNALSDRARAQEEALLPPLSPSPLPDETAEHLRKTLTSFNPPERFSVQTPTGSTFVTKDREPYPFPDAAGRATLEADTAKRNKLANLKRFLAGLQGPANNLTPQAAGVVSQLTPGAPGYSQARDKAKREVDDAVSDHPWMPLVGSLATAPLTPAAATIGSRLGLNAAQGFTGGYFGSQSTDEAAKLKDAAKSAAISSALGLGIEGAAGGIGWLLGTGGRAAPRAQEQAIKAMSNRGNINNKLQSMGYEDTDKALQELGQQALDNNLVRLGDSAADINKRAGALLSTAGDQRAALLSDLDAKALDPEAAMRGFSATGVTEDMQAALGRGKHGQGILPVEADTSGSANRAIDQMGRLTGTPNDSFTGATNQKSLFWGQINPRETVPLEMQNFRRTVSGAREGIERQANALTPGAGDSLRDINQTLGNALEVSALSGDSATRQIVNRSKLGNAVASELEGLGGLVAGTQSPTLPGSWSLAEGAKNLVDSRGQSSLAVMNNWLAKNPRFGATAQAVPLRLERGVATGLADRANDREEALTGGQSLASATPAVDPRWQFNAVDELAKRYGIDVGSKEELADQWWLKNN